MQFKIVRIRGQCRGHPKIRGTTREGPENCRLSIVDCQLSMDIDKLKIDNAESTIKNDLVVKRRWGELDTVGQLDSWTVGSMKSTVSGQRSAVSGQEFGIWNLEFGIPQKKPFRFRNSLARDWPIITCSVIPPIMQYRYKHRLNPKPDLPKNGGEGMVCVNG